MSTQLMNQLSELEKEYNHACSMLDKARAYSSATGFNCTNNDVIESENYVFEIKKRIDNMKSKSWAERAIEIVKEIDESYCITMKENMVAVNHIFDPNIHTAFIDENPDIKEVNVILGFYEMEWCIEYDITFTDNMIARETHNLVYNNLDDALEEWRNMQNLSVLIERILS